MMSEDEGARAREQDARASDRSALHPASVLDVVDLGSSWETLLSLAPGIELSVRAATAPAWMHDGHEVTVRIPAYAVIAWRSEPASRG